VPNKFLPGRYPITKFGRGGFEFAGMSHIGSLLILPSGMRALEAAHIERVTPQLASGLLEERSEIDFILIGTGANTLQLMLPFRGWLGSHQLPYDIMNTPAAIRTYNVMQDERRRVAALLIAVE
jgi:uncharacterized protein